MQFVLLRRSEPGAGLQFAFDTDTCGEVLLGRDPTCHISLDPNSDMVAAIFHARIQPDPKSPSGLIVIDLSSRNGTFVDGVPVRGQTVLSTNSILQLGRREGQAGPEFQVSIGEAPWQPAVPSPTRQVDTPPAPEPPRFNPPPPPWQPNAAAAPFRDGAPPAGSSRKWWEDKLPGVESIQQAAQRGGIPGLPRHVNVKESRFRWTNAVVVVIAVLSVLLALLWIRQGQAPSTWSAQTIEQAYGNSILATELSWKLVDGTTGKQVYRWRPRLPFKPNDPRLAIFQGKDRAFVFIRMPDGAIEPVLILGGGTAGNEPAGGKTSGSAVAVHSGGFVLTDLRNATPWTLPYEWAPGSFPAILIDPQSKQVDVIDRLNQSWMPLHARAVMAGEPTVDNLAAGALSPAPVVLEGRIDVYRERLRNSALWFQASPAATSERSQLAVAKLQTGQPLAEVRIPETDPPLPLGQRVFVLGYVGSPENTQLKTTEFQVLKAETTSINGPDEFALLAGSLSSVSQTGSAVFDSKGRLAGLLRVIPRNGEYLGEIVPIRHGRQLVRSDGTR